MVKWRKTESTLAPVIVFTGGTKSLPGQCWLIMNKVWWHLSEDIIMRYDNTNQQNKIVNWISKIALRSQRGQWVIHCSQMMYIVHYIWDVEGVIMTVTGIPQDTMVAIILNSAWWRHQMETFSALLAICAGNSPVPGEFHTQRPVTRSFDVYFDLRLNKRLSKQSWSWWFETLSRPLWCQCNGR